MQMDPLCIYVPDRSSIHHLLYITFKLIIIFSPSLPKVYICVLSQGASIKRTKIEVTRTHCSGWLEPRWTDLHEQDLCRVGRHGKQMIHGCCEHYTTSVSCSTRKVKKSCPKGQDGGVWSANDDDRTKQSWGPVMILPRQENDHLQMRWLLDLSTTGGEHYSRGWNSDLGHRWAPCKCVVVIRLF
jgi:hypothetical protein